MSRLGPPLRATPLAGTTPVSEQQHVLRASHVGTCVFFSQGGWGGGGGGLGWVGLDSPDLKNATDPSR